jgi:hypothetical protein
MHMQRGRERERKEERSRELSDATPADMQRAHHSHASMLAYGMSVKYEHAT